MIDLTPLDVRKKSGDFGKALRGYDPSEVDSFLGLVAERLEELVKENLTLRERSERLAEQVSSQEGRERAVQEALVTAQELRDDVRKQAAREADHVRKEAEAEAERLVREAERQVAERRSALEELERKRLRFLHQFRLLLERELDVVAVEEGRAPLEEVEVELDLGRRRALEVAEEEPKLDAVDPDRLVRPRPEFGENAEGLGDEVEEAFARAGAPEDGEPEEVVARRPREEGGRSPSASPANQRAPEEEGEVEEAGEAEEDEGTAGVQDDLWLSSVRSESGEGGPEEPEEGEGRGP